MLIGIVENTYGNRVVLWFYRRDNNRWVRIKKKVLTLTQRTYYLEQLMKDASISFLGRGI